MKTRKGFLGFVLLTATLLGVGCSSYKYPTSDESWKAELISGEVNPQYLVFDLADGGMSYLRSEPEGGWTDEYKTTKLVMRYVPAGSFMITVFKTNDVWSIMFPESAEKVDRKITISKPFYIGVFEVTQKQCELITGQSYVKSESGTYPVLDISYNQIRGKDKGSGWPENDEVDDDSIIGTMRKKFEMKFDLPTEMQWEYACRAGTKTDWNNGTNMADAKQDVNLDKLGCYNSKGPKAIGSYIPNAWGLYDMHGNAWEWCLDWYYYYLNELPAKDPKGRSNGKLRLLRGGSYNSSADECRSDFREAAYPKSGYGSSGCRPAPIYHPGFRLVLNL